jgi:hypothetical protein
MQYLLMIDQIAACRDWLRCTFIGFAAKFREISLRRFDRITRPMAGKSMTNEMLGDCPWAAPAGRYPVLYVDRARTLLSRGLST